MENNQEIWKPVPGWPYEVSNRGRVRRSDDSPRRVWLAGRILTPGKSGAGRDYLKVCLQANGKMRHVLIHRLVVEVFDGPIPPGMEVNHKSGDKSDNRWPENLEVVTHKKNQEHASKTGLMARGEGIPWSTFNEMQVRVIRRLRGRITQREAGEIFGTDQSHISQIQLGKIWGHVAA